MQLFPLASPTFMHKSTIKFKAHEYPESSKLENPTHDKGRFLNVS